MKFRNGYPALSQFLGGYFHQDFPIDYTTPDEAIEAFRTSETEELVRAVCKELQQALATIELHPKDTMPLLQNLGCYYDPSADDLTVVEWLRHVQDKLAC